MDMDRFGHFIEGEPRPGSAWRPVFEPASGQIYAEVADGSENDALLAVQAAEAAFPAWAALTTSE
ncbi:MAG: succinate-semialdehyde dehydrogenase (NADP(+)), partial [Xanthomonas sp.]|nr:succinate-semialdehyde dehydrogenase (NADP(+)) [Xanthomonas sp.]